MTTNAQQMTMSNDGETARCNVMFDDGHTEILVFDRPGKHSRQWQDDSSRAIRYTRSRSTCL